MIKKRTYGRMLVVGVLGMLLIGMASGYYCIQQEDNEGVIEFKYKLNELSVQKDLADGLTPEQINLKLKYFGPCR